MISSYCLGRAPLFFLQSSENRSAKKPISWSAIPPSSADCTRAVPIGSLVPLGEVAAFNRPRTFALMGYHETVCAESQ